MFKYQTTYSETLAVEEMRNDLGVMNIIIFAPLQGLVSGSAASLPSDTDLGVNDDLLNTRPHAANYLLWRK